MKKMKKKYGLLSTLVPKGKRQYSISKLWRIQKDFLRKIPGYSQSDYWGLLTILTMSSLERRRERYVIIQTEVQAMIYKF